MTGSDPAERETPGDGPGDAIVIAATSPVYRDVLLLAAAWGTSPSAAVRRLVDYYYAGHAEPGRPSVSDQDVAVHVFYAATRVEGFFRPVAGSITIVGEIAAGTYKSPSGARAAVVSALRPGISPQGSGWGFWTVTATGGKLSSIRNLR